MRYGLNNTTKVMLLTAVVRNIVCSSGTADTGKQRDVVLIMLLLDSMSYRTCMVKLKHSFNIQMYKQVIVLQSLKSVTLHIGVSYHRMDDIAQCLFNLHIK